MTPSSLGKRFSRLFLYAGLIFGVTVLIFFLIIDYLSLSSHHRDRYSAQVDFFVEQLRGPVAFRDDEALRTLIQSLSRDEGILAIRVDLSDSALNLPEQAPFYNWVKEGQTLSGCGHPRGALAFLHSMVVIAPLIVFNQTTGRVCVLVSLDALHAHWRSSLQAVLLAFLLFSVLWWRFTLFTRHQFQEVFSRFNRLFAQVREQGLKGPIALESHGVSELQPVADVFNQMLEDLRTQQNQLLHNQRLTTVGRVAMGAAHEVGNPLMCISTLIQDMEQIWQRKGSFDHQKAGLIRQQVQRIQQVLALMNQYGKPYSYPNQLHLTSVNLLLAVESAIALLKLDARYQLRRPKLTHTVSSQVFVRADSDRLQQVLINLLNNALDACWERGEISMDWRPDRLFGHALVIQDTGVGIKAQSLDSVFDPFFSEKQRFMGTGLGLWVARDLMQAMGGEIRIESVWGEGSRVYLSFTEEGV
jgi:signal transduction histidine kinase